MGARKLFFMLFLLFLPRNKKQKKQNWWKGCEKLFFLLLLLFLPEIDMGIGGTKAAFPAFSPSIKKQKN